MISQSESGLSALDYAKIQDPAYTSNFRVVAERINPLWENASTAGGSDTGFMSASVHNNVVFRLTTAGLEQMSPTLGPTAVPGFTWRAGPTLLDATVISGNGVLAVIACYSDGVYFTYSTNGTTGWAAWVASNAGTTHTVITTSATDFTAGAAVATSSALAGGSTVAMLFDNNTANVYRASVPVHNVTINHGGSLAPMKITMRAESWAATDTTSYKNTPKKFYVDYWNGSAYVLMATVTNQIAWKSGEVRTFEFPYNATYISSRIRIRFDKNNGGTELRLSEIEAFGNTSTSQPINIKVDAIVWDRVTVVQQNINTGDNLVRVYTRPNNTSGTWTLHSSSSYDNQIIDIAGALTATSILTSVPVIARSPGRQTARTVNNVLETFVYNATAVGFLDAADTTYISSAIDQIDSSEDWSIRHWEEINFSQVGSTGKYFLSVMENLRSDIFDLSYTSSHIYVISQAQLSSKLWTRGERFDSPASVAGKYIGAPKFFELTSGGTQYVAAVYKNGVSYTKYCSMFGETVHSSMSLDLSGMVSDYSFERGENVSSTGSINDSSGAIFSSTVFGPGIRTQLKHYFGVWNGATRIDTLVGTTEIDSIERTESSLNAPYYRFTSRDIAFRASDKYQGLSFYETPNFNAYIDNFDLSSDGAYSGLGHIFTISGQFEGVADSTNGGYSLVAKYDSANPGPAIAFFTFDDMSYSGIINMRPPDLATTPWATFSILFRAINKDNYSAIEITKAGLVSYVRVSDGVVVYQSSTTPVNVANVAAYGVWVRFAASSAVVYVRDSVGAFSMVPAYTLPQVQKRVVQTVGSLPYILVEKDDPVAGYVGVRFA